MTTKKQDKRRRTRGTGGIRELRPGVWRLAYSTGAATDGKRHRKEVVFKGTRTEAAKKLTQLTGQVASGDYKDPVRMPLADYLRSWLEDIGIRQAVSPSTLRGYGQKVHEYIIPTLGKIALSSLDRSHVYELQRAMAKAGKSPTTQMHAQTVLNTALNHAVETVQGFNHNPLAKAKRPKQKKRPMTLFDVAAYQVFIAKAEGSPYRDVFYLAFATGTRRSEVLALRWRDVDLQAGTVSINGALQRIKGQGLVRLEFTKSDTSNRAIVVDRDVVEMLEARRLEAADAEHRIPAWKDDDYVFTTRIGKPFDPDKVTHEFTAIRKAAGIDVGRLHDARHSVATWLLADGEDPQQVAALLGHSTPATTFRFYSHAIPGRGHQTAARLTRIRSGAATDA